MGDLAKEWPTHYSPPKNVQKRLCLLYLQEKNLCRALKGGIFEHWRKGG
jgi:hypothetical protein